jgi:hypothetical protein
MSTSTRVAAGVTSAYLRDLARGSAPAARRNAGSSSRRSTAARRTARTASAHASFVSADRRVGVGSHA